jgi:hypothetical protein
MRPQFSFGIPPDGCVSESLQQQILEHERLGISLHLLARRRRVTLAFMNYLRKEVIGARLSR